MEGKPHIDFVIFFLLVHQTISNCHFFKFSNCGESTYGLFNSNSLQFEAQINESSNYDIDKHGVSYNQGLEATLWVRLGPTWPRLVVNSDSAIGMQHGHLRVKGQG